MAKGACLFKAEKPGDPRNRYALILQIAIGQARLKLLEDFLKCQAFLGEPTRQRPLAYTELSCHDIRTRLAMRKQWGDRIFDFDAECALFCAYESSSSLRIP